MRFVLAVGLAIGCGGGKSADSGSGGDADTDTDADADTDTTTGPLALTCPAAACDGDPTGTWSVLGECIATPEIEEVRTRCDGVAVNLYQGLPDGTLTFDGNTYSFQVNLSGTTAIEYLVPEDCNTDGCLNWQTQDPLVDCTVDGDGGCRCTGNEPTSVWSDSGTWTRSGGTLSLHSDTTGGDRTLDVCATGDALWLYDAVRDESLSAVPQP